MSISNFKDYSQVKKQETFLGLHIFEEYGSSEGKVISIQNVIDSQKDEL